MEEERQQKRSEFERELIFSKLGVIYKFFKVENTAKKSSMISEYAFEGFAPNPTSSFCLDTKKEAKKVKASPALLERCTLIS